MTDLSFIEIYTAEATGARHNIRARFGPGSIETKGGGGIWEEVKRPYLPPLTIWRGPSEALQHTIPILFDGWSDSNVDAVTEEKRELDLMAGVLNGNVEPPQLILNGHGTIDYDVVQEPHLTWVIKEPPTWSEYVRLENGGLVRAMAKVTLMVYNQDQTLRREARPHRGHQHYAKGGETWESLASSRHGLHHPGWGTRLANFNGRSNANEHLHAGQGFYLPDKAEVQSWKRSHRR